MVAQEDNLGNYVHYYLAYKDGDSYKIGVRGKQGNVEEYIGKYYTGLCYINSRPAGAHDDKGRHIPNGLIVSCDIKQDTSWIG